MDSDAHMDSFMNSRDLDAGVLLVMTVEIGDGRSDSIEVRAGDSPLELAEAFVRAHNLGESIIQPLAAHIEFNLNAVETRTLSEGTVRAGTASASRPKARKKPKQKPKSVEALISRLYEKPRKKKAALDAPPPNPELTLRPSINESSRRMASSLSGKVHSRLYARANETRKKIEERKVQLEKLEQVTIESTRIPISEVSRELSKNRFSKDKHTNYGAMLYDDGMKKKSELEELAQKEKEKKQYDPELTLRPKINPSSVRKDDPAWKRLSEHARKLKVHLDHQKLKEEEKELAECTFRPEISRRSAKMMEERSSAISTNGPSSHFDHLYEEAVKRRTRAAIYDQWLPPDVTFHPNIGRNSRRPRNDSDDEAFVNRLAYSKLEREQILDDLREQVNKPIDPHTGQPLFRPRVGRPPRFERPPGSSVAEHLYAERHEYAKARQDLQDKEDERLKSLREKPATFSREVSKRLSEMRKRKRLTQIFSTLDASKRGVLNLREGVDGSALDPEVRADILPLLKDASVMVDELSLDEFCALVDDYLRAQQNGPRSYLERRESSKSVHSEPPGKKVVKARQNLVDELVSEAEKWAIRREERRKELEEQEIAFCTFKPRISGSPSPSRSSPRMSLSDSIAGRHRIAVDTNSGEEDESAGATATAQPSRMTESAPQTRKSLAVINRLKAQYLEDSEDESEDHGKTRSSVLPEGRYMWKRKEDDESEDDDDDEDDKEQAVQRELRVLKRTAGLVSSRAHDGSPESLENSRRQRRPVWESEDDDDD